MAVIETRDLVKTFGRHRALDGADLTVDEGTVHGFVPPWSPAGWWSFGPAAS